jgi:hypothetical protein
MKAFLMKEFLGSKTFWGQASTITQLQPIGHWNLSASGVDRHFTLGLLMQATRKGAIPGLIISLGRVAHTPIHRGVRCNFCSRMGWRIPRSIGVCAALKLNRIEALNPVPFFSINHSPVQKLYV